VNFLFWNLHKNDLTDCIKDIVSEKDIDMVILAESEGIKKSELLEALSSIGDPTFLFNPAYNDSDHRIQIFSRLPSKSVLSIGDPDTITIRVVQPPASEEFLLIAVHLTSKREHSDEDLSDLCGRIRQELDSAEKKRGHRRSILVGDFNMDPFEKGVISSEKLHAVMSKCVAKKDKRVVRYKENFFLYNPMWSLYGDLSDGPPGSYFNWKSKPNCYFWHIFDQVLIRPDLIECFDSRKLEIITKAGTMDLATNNGRPNKGDISDHFPLVFTFNMTRII